MVFDAHKFKMKKGSYRRKGGMDLYERKHNKKTTE
jgi:hypothetical protein